MDKDTFEKFNNEYLRYTNPDVYLLDDITGNGWAYPNDRIIYGQGKYFTDLEEYGRYLAEYHGYDEVTIPRRDIYQGGIFDVTEEEDS